METTGQEVVAYTMGSFWICPPCYSASKDVGTQTATAVPEIVTTESLMTCGCYSYYCDACGVRIG